MKKIIFLLMLISFIFTANSAFAQTTSANTTDWANDANLKRVNTIGQRILKLNNLPTEIKFQVSDKDEVNAYADINNDIYVYTGLLKFVENDEELAAVISHEVGHIVNKHCQKQTVLGVIVSPISKITKNAVMSNILDKVGVLSLLKVSRSAEYEADLTGVDLMIGAKYNPQSMISVLNKISGNYMDILSSHPSGNKRLVNIYDYLSYNYPSEIKTPYNTQSYKSFEQYMVTILTERRSSTKAQAAYEKKQLKLREARLKRAKTIKKGTNGWEASFNVLNATINALQQ